MINFNKIESVKPKLPELEGTEEQFMERFRKLKEDEARLWEARQKVNAIQEEVDKQKKEFTSLKDLYEITYAEEAINEIHNTVHMQIINDSDYRNHD